MGRTLAIAAMLSICISGVAFAQSDIIPPKSYTVTPGGINIADGSFVYSVTDLSLGPMTLQRFYRTGTPQPNEAPFGKNFSHNFDIYVAATQRPPPTDARYPIVHMGSRASGVYSQSNSQLTTVNPNNMDAERGRLTFNGSQYVFVDGSDASGTIYTFSATVQAVGAPNVSFSRRIERIDFPDGRRQTFSYNANGHLKLVEDSSGYAMVFDYDANGDITAACAFNRSQTFVSATSTCSGAQMKTTYAYTSLYLTSVTDVLQHVTTYTNSSMGLTCLKPPGYSTCTISMPSHSGRVASQTLQDGGTWSAGGLNPNVLNDPEAGYDGDGTNEAHVTDPNNVTINFRFTKTSPYQMTDANGNVTHFRYEGAHQFNDISGVYSDGTFLMEVTHPEGNKYQAQYLGPFRAITKETLVPKPGSGLASIVKDYGYGSCSAPGSDQNCARPIWVKDPKGFQTDYTYAAHGGMLTERKPPPTAGAPRPLKILNYVQKSAYIKNSSGALVPAATQIWVVNSETQCQTVAGSSTAVCDTGPGAPLVVTSYQYGANGSADNLLVRGIAVTADGQTHRKCYRYDTFARRISETRPNANLSVCP
jgi:YD repeat-containing protein